MDIKSIENIEVVKLNKAQNNSTYIKLNGDASINGVKLQNKKMYRLRFACLDRASNDNDEFFFAKANTSFIPDKATELSEKLKKIIEEN